jgi:hypothetical protein
MNVKKASRADATGALSRRVALSFLETCITFLFSFLGEKLREDVVFDSLCRVDMYTVVVLLFLVRSPLPSEIFVFLRRCHCHVYFGGRKMFVPLILLDKASLLFILFTGGHFKQSRTSFFLQFFFTLFELLQGLSLNDALMLILYFRSWNMASTILNNVSTSVTRRLATLCMHRNRDSLFYQCFVSNDSV